MLKALVGVTLVLAACSSPDAPADVCTAVPSQELFDLLWTPTAAPPAGCELGLPTLLAIDAKAPVGYQNVACCAWGAAEVSRSTDAVQIGETSMGSCDEHAVRIHASTLALLQDGHALEGDVDVESGDCRITYHVRGFER